MNFTPCECEILREIQRRGKVKSLARLVNEMSLSYSYSHRCVSRLERRGEIAVLRGGRGKALVITPLDWYEG